MCIQKNGQAVRPTGCGIEQVWIMVSKPFLATQSDRCYLNQPFKLVLDDVHDFFRQDLYMFATQVDGDTRLQVHAYCADL